MVLPVETLGHSSPRGVAAAVLAEPAQEALVPRVPPATTSSEARAAAVERTWVPPAPEVREALAVWAAEEAAVVALV
jgi:hypothetical protein